MSGFEELSLARHAIGAVLLLFIAGCGLGSVCVSSLLPRRICQVGASTKKQTGSSERRTNVGSKRAVSDAFFTCGPYVDRFLIEISAGIFLLGWTGLVLGMCGVLNGLRPAWLMVGCAMLNLRHLPRWCHLGWRFQIARPSIPLIVMGCVSVCLAVTTLGPALCYPTSWDELVYHETLPQRWSADGWPAFYLDLPYSGFPSLGEILFWLMAPIDRLIAPRLLMWACWCIGLANVCRTLQRVVRFEVALSLVLIMAFNDTFMLICANTYVECIQLMGVSAIFLALSRIPNSELSEWPCAVLIGVLSAAPAAVKLTGGAALTLPPLWYCIRSLRQPHPFQKAFRLGGVFGLTCFATLLPFYFRPWWFTGNPFYPYFSEWFSQAPVVLEVSRFHHQIGGLGFGVRTASAFVAGPLLLAFRESNYDGEFGWQFLGLVVLAILGLVSAIRYRRRRLVIWPASAACWLYVFWFVTSQQARFALPVAVAFVLVAAYGLRLMRQRLRWIVLSGMLVAGFISLPWHSSDYHYGSWMAVFGQMRRVDYVHNLTDYGYLPTIQAIEAYIPAGERILLLFEHRSLYIPRPCRIGTPLFQEGPFSPPQQFTKAAEVLSQLRNEGILHIVMTKASAGPDHAPGSFERQQLLIRGLQECLQNGDLMAVWECDSHVILRVRETDEAR
jgi:hypothetical protein